MSTQTSPSIVFGHGIWTDGWCFNKVISALVAEGYEVSRPIGLDSNEGDAVGAGWSEGVRIRNQTVRVDP